MEEISLRPGVESDLPALLDLYMEFHEFHAEHLPAYLSSLNSPSEEMQAIFLNRIRDIIHEEGKIILVAEKSDRLIGLAEVHLKRPNPDNIGAVPLITAHLQSLIITREHRQKGYGSQLLRYAETWARQQGAVEMRLDIWEFQDGPLDFYRKTGYRTLRRSMARHL